MGKRIKSKTRTSRAEERKREAKGNFLGPRPNLTVSRAAADAAAVDGAGRLLVPLFFDGSNLLTPADAHWAWTKACR